MVEIHDDGKHHAICDCCFERSFDYDSDKELRKGLKYEGWYHHWNPEEQEWETFCVDCKEAK